MPGVRKRSAKPVVAILGGGFSGVAVAYALLEDPRFGGSIVIVEPRARLGVGLAYGEAHAGEILNTRVRDMSIADATPGDFMRWIEATGSVLPAQRGVRDRGGVFAPRALFGAYVESRFAERRAARADLAVEHLRALATSVATNESGGVSIATDGGRRLDADALVLATGFGAPQRAHRFGIAPFSKFHPDAEMARVTLVGSSLTMVDVLLRLRRDGYRGRIDIVSRRALLPLPQSVEATGRRRPWTEPPGPGLSKLMRALRRAAQAEQAAGADWRDAVNGLRPHVPAHWNALTAADRRRFLQRARPYWDAHRHRLPFDQHQRVLRELIAGETTLSQAEAIAGGEGVALSRRRGLTPVDGPVVDCSGHRPDLSAPLMQSLFAEGLARADDLGLGVAVGADGAVVGGADASRCVFALGPLGVGSLVEITATPEIVCQAAASARAIASHLEKMSSPGRA